MGNNSHLFGGNNSVCLVKNNLSLSPWKNNCLPEEEFLRAHAKKNPWARKNKSGPRQTKKRPDIFFYIGT